MGSQRTCCVFRNLREDPKEVSYGFVEPLDLHDEVLRFNPEAFSFNAPGKESIWFIFSCSWLFYFTCFAFYFKLSFDDVSKCKCRFNMEIYV